VVWAEPEAIAWAPVDVSGELRDRLWDGGPTAVLVSATLTTGEDATFVRRRLGLDEARELVVGSPYDFGEQALLYVPKTMPDPRAEGFVERVGDEVVELLALSCGRALVLTSSYRALDALRARIAGRVPYEVLVQGEAPRERLLARFRDESSPCCSRRRRSGGRRVPASHCHLVIDKLPFSAPGDPLTGAVRGGRSLRGDWFRDFALPTAMLQLRTLRASSAARGPGRGRDPRSPSAHEALRPRVPRRPPRCPIVDDQSGRGGVLRGGVDTLLDERYRR
jgi:ATP-dependent DNA helicase DinG